MKPIQIGVLGICLFFAGLKGLVFSGDYPTSLQKLISIVVMSVGLVLSGYALILYKLRRQNK